MHLGDGAWSLMIPVGTFPTELALLAGGRAVHRVQR
jgi:hypothetical protein